MDSLTPHKMFRTAFLDEHGLRFPEGRRRLEDHVFVAEAYFLAERISVLADYHCYFHVGRADAGNAGYQRIDPPGYYGYVREVVDIVLARTEPGPLRDRCLRRPLRTELLGRLDGAAFLAQDPHTNARCSTKRARCRRDDPAERRRRTARPQRVRAELLRADRRSDLAAYVEHGLRLGLDVRLLAVRWEEGGILALDFEGALVDQTTGEPWRYHRDGKALLMPGPDALRDTVPREVLDCAKLLPSARLDLLLRRRADSEEWPVPSESSFDLHEEGDRLSVSYRATARIDPRTLGGGATLTAGIWDAYARVTQTGFGRQARLGAHRAEGVTGQLRTALLSGQLMTPYWTEPYSNLSLDVGANPNRLLRDIREGDDRVAVHRAADGTPTLRVTVPLELEPGAAPIGVVTLEQRSSNLSVALDADQVERGPDGLSLTSALPELEWGDWQVLVTLDAERWRVPRPTGVRLTVSESGEVTVAAIAAKPVGAQVVKASTALRRVLRRARGRAGALRRRAARLRRSWRR